MLSSSISHLLMQFWLSNLLNQRHSKYMYIFNMGLEIMPSVNYKLIIIIRRLLFWMIFLKNYLRLIWKIMHNDVFFTIYFHYQKKNKNNNTWWTLKNSSVTVSFLLYVLRQDRKRKNPEDSKHMEGNHNIGNILEIIFHIHFPSC